MIEEYLAEGHRKAAGAMRDGYEIARDPKQWDADQEDLRQSRVAAEEEVDELEGDDEDVEGSAGKRKKPAKEKSKAKKPKTAKKVSRSRGGRCCGVCVSVTQGCDRMWQGPHLAK